MQEINTIDQMVIAYRKLYVIETTLRKLVKDILEEKYGPHWQHIAPMQHLKRFVKPVDSINLHELINYFNIYPPLRDIFNSKQKASLFQLPSIRNKIAHCHYLESSELEKLDENFSIVLTVTKDEQLKV